MPGEVQVDDELLEAFKTSLAEHKIEVRFVSGSWLNFRSPFPFGRHSDLIVTSETIYQTTSTPSLIAVLKRESVARADDLHELRKLSHNSPPVILVAAKVLYFGVGGGVKEFITAVEEAQGKVETVWEMTQGVGRQVLHITF